MKSQNPRISRGEGTFGVILCASKESCCAVSDALKQLMRKFCWWLTSSHFVGGENRGHEKARLRKGVTVMVATDTRLLDHLEVLILVAIICICNSWSHSAVPHQEAGWQLAARSALVTYLIQLGVYHWRSEIRKFVDNRLLLISNVACCNLSWRPGAQCQYFPIVHTEDL